MGLRNAGDEIDLIWYGIVTAFMERMATSNPFDAHPTPA